MAVYAVVGRVDLSANEPFPEGRVIGIEGGVPVFVPAQQVSIFPKALGKILFAEALNYTGIGQVCLADEGRERIVVFLSPPVDRNLRFTGLCCCSLSRKDFGHINPLYV